METEPVKTFRSSKGVVISLKPVSQFKLDSLTRTKNEVVAPVYETAAVTGEKQIFPLDEEIAKNRGRLDEWNEYQAACKAAESAYAQKFTEMMIWEGVDVEVPGPDSEWQDSCNHFGVKIPENRIERKLFYIYNELLGKADDIGELIAEILSVSQIDEEAVSAMRRTFRAELQGKGNSGLPKKPGKLENNKSNVQ